ncbi:Serine/threonine protein kinase [Fusarium oxysporum f. sp. albedinis]|nr:Uncharacterized protein HZ326_31101 [Fusarium oxysporum f. sp. albedinis]KAJ0131132.1 Serine/threonine protein kinase [Fusarium oxysporum f. sp. albedinis]
MALTNTPNLSPTHLHWIDFPAALSSFAYNDASAWYLCNGPYLDGAWIKTLKGRVGGLRNFVPKNTTRKLNHLSLHFEGAGVRPLECPPPQISTPKPLFM